VRSLPEVFKALSDPTRLRILRVLDGVELNVNELVEILEVAQPTVSRHLGLLLRAGLVGRRRDGMWTFYSTSIGAGWLGANGFGPVLRRELREQQDEHGDMARLADCLAARAQRSREFYARFAPAWDRLRAGLDIEGLHGRVLGGLLPGALDLVDAGTGTGALLPVLAPAARRLVGVDHSPEMLAEASRRLVGEDRVRVMLVRADLASLPFPDASVDGVCSVLALHHVPRPAEVVAEFVRVVRPGGRVVISDLAQHAEEWMRDELAHLWLGFAPERVHEWFDAAGLEDIRTGTIPRRRSSDGPRVPDVWIVQGRRPDRQARPSTAGTTTNRQFEDLTPRQERT